MKYIVLVLDYMQFASINLEYYDKYAILSPAPLSARARAGQQYMWCSITIYYVN
jgi:hypothetical protein